ncbi:MAG: 2OG-Fe(II) oxygenase [Chromatiales bacterium]|jgi:hypothetical protein
MAEDDFIGEFDQGIDAEVCQGLVSLFNTAHKRKLTNPGKTGSGVDKKRKDSTDFPDGKMNDILRKKYGHYVDSFLDQLMNCYHEYENKYSVLKHPKTWPLAIYSWNIQRYYGGGQAYHVWHYENPTPAFMDRVLSWITYLNTVEEGGETEFLYQEKKVQPVEGKTVIWPGHFTHTHRSLPSPETKFVIVGSFRFAEAPGQQRMQNLR